MNPHNMNYYFGNDLREHPEDKIAFKKGIDYLIKQLEQKEEVIEQAKLLSKIGTYQRIAGFFNASLLHLKKAKQLLEESNHQHLFLINEIRLAHTFQFLKQFEQADACYQHIEDYITKHPSHKNLLHFVYQHNGKNYFDQQQYELAETCICKALELHKVMGNEGLIESSAFALKVIRESKSCT